MKTVLLYALVAVVIALVTGPIPGSSLLLTGLETVMAFHIARRYGFHLDFGEISSVATAIFAASALLKLAVSTLLEFVPVLGWFIAKPAIAFLFVVMLGTVADRYFRDKRQVLSAAA